MRTLVDYKLMIDKDCPMCRAYGNTFEKTGMLEKGACSPYQLVDTETTNKIDMRKARNEIALYNTKTHEVIYGLDSLVYIITHSFGFLKPILQSPPIDYFLRKLYKFISFNRKIIAPSTMKVDERNCSPDLNIKYRLLYIAFVVLVSSTVLFFFTKPINHLFGWQSLIGREFLICAGQILWQSIVLQGVLKTKLLDYIGNMMTVSMVGTLLLLPLCFTNSLSPIFHLVYFGLVVGFMFIEHIRRCSILRIGLIPSISWAIYRLLVIIIIQFWAN